MKSVVIWQGRSWTLHVGRRVPMEEHRLGTEWAALWKGPGRVMAIRLGRIQQGSAVSGWRKVVVPIYPALDHIWILCLVLGAWKQESGKLAWVQWRATSGALARLGEPEGARLDQLQEDTVLGGPNHSIPLPVTTSSRGWGLALLSGTRWENDRQQAEVEMGGSHWVWGETFSPWGGLDTRTGYPEEVVHSPSLENFEARLKPWVTARLTLL